MLNAAALGEQVAGLARRLPPFPRIVMRLLDLVEDEEVSLQALARLARNDPVISSGILTAANRLRRIKAQPEIHDPFVAASLIGLTQVRRIVLTAAMNRFAADDRGANFLSAHSRAVAIVAQELAWLHGISGEMAYVVGILHDVGQLCFHVMDSARFREAYTRAAADGRLLEHERAAFGVDHALLGGALARHWELPEDYAEAIEAHHEDARASSPLQAVVNLAESLARALDIPPSPRNRLIGLNTEAVKLLGIDWSSQEIRDCLGRCRARFCQPVG